MSKAKWFDSGYQLKINIWNNIRMKNRGYFQIRDFIMKVATLMSLYRKLESLYRFILFSMYYVHTIIYIDGIDNSVYSWCICCACRIYNKIFTIRRFIFNPVKMVDIYYSTQYAYIYTHTYIYIIMSGCDLYLDR